MWENCSNHVADWMPYLLYFKKGKVKLACMSITSSYFPYLLYKYDIWLLLPYQKRHIQKLLFGILPTYVLNEKLRLYFILLRISSGYVALISLNWQWGKYTKYSIAILIIYFYLFILLEMNLEMLNVSL